MNKYKYVEIVTGEIKYNRGNVVKLDSLQSHINLDYFNSSKPVINGFHSAFCHTKDFLNYENDDSSKSGYDGEVFSEYLFWDMDNKDIDKAREDTIELVDSLSAYNSENVLIYYSGNKGFHVYYMCPELQKFIDNIEFNNIIKNTCIDFAFNLNSFDSKIYDKTRIIRTPNSLHPVTNKYKVHLTIEELNSLTNNEMEVLSSSKRKRDFNTLQNNTNEDMLDIIKNVKSHNKKSNRIFCAGELLDGIVNGFEEGKRNSGYASIAGLLHRRNIDEDFIRSIIYAINKNSNPPVSEQEIDTIVRSIGRYSIDDSYRPAESDDIISIEQASKAWYEIITSSGYCSFGDRFQHLNNRMKLCIPGDTVAIVASSGVGKTTWGLELGNAEAKSKDGYSLMASLEMSRAGIFFRAATIESEELSIDNYVPSTEVAEALLKDSTLKTKVIDKWNNLKIIDRGGLTLDKIVEYYKVAQDLYKNKFSNLVIDYAQNIYGSEEITYSMGMARRFKAVAKDLNTKVIVLMQTNKTLSDDFTEIQKNHIEGAGAYYQAMDYIISAWKSREQNNRIHCKLMKDRWGGSDYKFDMVRNGLKYHTENFVPDRMSYGGL